MMLDRKTGAMPVRGRASYGSERVQAPISRDAFATGTTAKSDWCGFQNF